MDRIIYKYGDTPLFTPNPDVIKYYIGRWSARHQPLWLRYYNAVMAEYDPISNYDRTEQIDLTHGKKVTYGGSITDGTSGTITDTPSGTVKVERDDTTTETVSAYNSSSYDPAKQTVLDGETNTSYTNYKEERSFTNYEEKRTFNNTDTNSGKDSTSIHAYGNIGVTTSQQMVLAELDLVPRLDLIDFIADDWHSEFNLMIYV